MTEVESWWRDIDEGGADTTEVAHTDDHSKGDTTTRVTSRRRSDPG